MLSIRKTVKLTVNFEPQFKGNINLIKTYSNFLLCLLARVLTISPSFLGNFGTTLTLEMCWTGRRIRPK